MQNNNYFPEIHGNLGFSSICLPMKGEEVDTAKFRKMADAFLDAGFNYFDTGHDYFGGRAEQVFRECVAKRHPRESFLLANKLKESCFMKERDILPFFEKQLDWCGVDYFDFYLMDEQNQFNYQVFKEQKAYETASRLKKEGLIRHIGISFHDTPELLDIILTEHPEIEFVQIRFNYADYAEPPIESRLVYSTCVKHGKPVNVMHPLKGGKLVDLPEDAEQLLRNLGGGSNASYALRFAASFPNTIMILPGSSDMGHLRENCSVMKEFHPLDQEEMNTIYDASTAIYSMTEIPCIACGKCIKDSVCKRLIRIPELFAALNSYVTYHDRNAKYYYHNVLTGHGHGKASDCAMCASCEKVCPQQLNIRQLLKKVAATFE